MTSPLTDSPPGPPLAPEPGPLGDPGPAEPPGWAPLPDPPPGPARPDEVPPGDAGAPDGAAAAAGAGRSTRGSTNRGAVSKVTAAGLGEAMTSVFRGGGQVLNHLAAADEKDTIWLPSDAEAEAVGEPLGRIIARRVPDLPGQDASDLADGIAAAIPAAIWLLKNGVEWVSRRRRKPKIAPGQVLAPDVSQADQA